jgi:hypothetical protein
MSGYVCVSRGDGDCLEVRVDETCIVISELRIRPSSNWVKPYQLLGKGQASIMLTNEQVLKVVAEYFRYTLGEAVTYEQAGVGFKFDCVMSVVT